VRNSWPSTARTVLSPVRCLGFCSASQFSAADFAAVLAVYTRDVHEDGHRAMNRALLVTQRPRRYIRPRALDIAAVPDENFSSSTCPRPRRVKLVDSAGAIRRTLSARKNPHRSNSFGTSSFLLIQASAQGRVRKQCGHRPDQPPATRHPYLVDDQIQEFVCSINASWPRAEPPDRKITACESANEKNRGWKGLAP